MIVITIGELSIGKKLKCPPATQDDNQASAAREAAVSIEEKTAEVQAQRARDADRAKAQRAGETRRQARAGQTQVGTMSDIPVRESKEFDDQLQLLMNEVFGK